MENLNHTLPAEVPPTPQCATTQKDTGSTTISAQNGSVVSQPQLSGVHVKGDLTVNTYVQAPARTDETNVVSPKTKENIQRCQDELKSYLENSTKNLLQVTKEDGSSTPLNKLYTELYITEGGSGEVNSEHEVVELECRRCASEEKKIQLNDILKALPNEEKPPQRVLTKGIAGIGKSVAVQKFTQDWAVGKANQSFQLIFPFTFRDLNLIKDKDYSLMDLIGHYFEEVKDLEPSDYKSSSVLFIFDGLDEGKFPLNFEKNEMCRSVTKTTTVDVLLTNLIAGKLLHKASIWITSRPAAASKIPPECIDRVTEVRGFNDEQKEEYFRKKISDQDVAQKISDHLQSKPMRTLYIMCHIPMFCLISATALQSLLTGTHESELPKTVTEMYTHFLIIQTTRKNEKDYQEVETDKERKKERDKDVIMKLGKLAFEQLQKGNIIFYEKDLKECQIDLKEAAVYSGVCTQIIRRESGLHRQEVYSFVHLSVQEFLAALYVLETFIESGQNLLPSQSKVRVRSEKGESLIVLLHKSAVDMTLAGDHGQWDLFLRFLLGLSQNKNQSLLQKGFGFNVRSPLNNQETINYIHEKIKKLSDTDKSINLFQCLNELGDQSLVEQVQKYQSSGDVSKISPAHWSALAFILLVSNEDLDVFDLKKYHKSNEVLERMLPVLKASKKALLGDCNLTDRCCEFISSVLSFKSSSLEELDLSSNQLQDSGIKLLSDGLKNPNCKLQRLSLKDCSITTKGCQSLATGLSSNSSHLKELDLSYNKFHGGGLKVLSEVLNKCSLETLRLCACGITEDGCKSLALALSSNPSHLKNLDLSKNSFGGQAVAQLCGFLKHPDCQLERLWLFNTNLQKECAAALASALASNPSKLRELDLGANILEDAGVMELSSLLKDPNCKMETLRLAGCRITDSGCAALATSLRSNPAHLRVLDLAINDLRDHGVQLLSEFLAESLCQLETLKLADCQITDSGCAALASSLRSNPAHLRVLDLARNDLRDHGVQLLSDFLAESLCQLETLKLADCQITDSGCAALASSLRSNPAHLRVLDLARNDLRDHGVQLLSDFLAESLCQLETLNLSGCMVSEEGCASLASALASNPFHLRELDLSYNHPGASGEKMLKNPHCKLITLRVDHCGEQRLKPGVRKYVCELKLDTNTVNRNLKLSDNNRTVTAVTEEQPYPEHPERFDHWEQLLCRNGLTGRCYWEVKWSGEVLISVSYRGIRRKGDRTDCWFGGNNQSWSLRCSDGGHYSVWHNNTRTDLPSSSSSVPNRVGVYVNYPAGTLSFYRVSSDTLIHLHTFNTTFTEPLYPGFWCGLFPGSSVSLCSV
ncbi:NACHT, LRR and PYD domains-containing protein 12-like isoform X1 [Thunnus albacares]|uniref:NACHT, LRR and PYD domains-containing protein 12-like isoform X1 n=2 Tax=Thunnus albacares TaxID=8236 RepID=UPI001CF6237D|nr:NACHT, LRR and PYD domains-containing protein 12-like isoform X1 [Thunnus albacares]